MTTKSIEELLLATRLNDGEQYEEAFRRYKILAEQGSVESQVLLGWMYQLGRGVKQDDEAAIAWFARAATGGSVEGEFYLAKSYSRRRNYDQALAHYQRAAAKKYSPAWFKLGRMYETGRGVARNQEDAFRYYERAAMRGHMYGLRCYALLLIKGQRGQLGRIKGIVNLVKAIYIAGRLGWKEPHSERLRD